MSGSPSPRRLRTVDRRGTAGAVLATALCLALAMAGTALGGSAPGLADATSGPPAAELDPSAAPPGTTQVISAGPDGLTGSGTSGGGATELLAGANGDQAISADGRWVAFATTAPNLVAGTEHPAGGLFLRDRQTGATTAVPWLEDGPFPTGILAAEPAISSDGGVLAFTAIVTPGAAPGGVAARSTTPFVMVWDRQTDRPEVVSVDAAGQPTPGFQPSISADGRYVAYTAWAVPTAPPTLSDLTTTGFESGGQRFVYGPSAPCTPHEATISVRATDPDDAVSAVTLFFQPAGSNVLEAPMRAAGGEAWQATITIEDVWGTGQIAYWVQATDEAGNRSAPLFSAQPYILSKGDCIL